jgi:hypothetical protein
MNIDLDKVPLTPNESLSMFMAALTDEEKKALHDVSDDQIALFLHSWGVEIINLWSLNEANTPITNGYKLLGITHPSDIVNIILLSTHRQLHKKPIKLKEQIQTIQEYWKKEIGKPMP